MEEFLSNTKTSLDDIPNYETVHIVFGNESCDLDSAVCAITYAYYLQKTNREPSTLIVPVLNIPASHLRLRTEITYFFSRLNIPIEALVFKDDVDFHSLQNLGKLKLTLVDHNVLTGDFTQFEESVVRVIDHHVQERPSKINVTVNLDMVGSCSTLVAEELLSDPDFTMETNTAMLLYGTILVDTINRSKAAKKITPRDEAVLDDLEKYLPGVVGETLFNELQVAKFDVTQFTNAELLERDLKVVSGDKGTVTMSSITMEMSTLLQRENFLDDLVTFSQCKNSDSNIIMTLTEIDGNPYRQIAIYSKNIDLRNEIITMLEKDSEIDLRGGQNSSLSENIKVYQQSAAASRKKVMPIIKQVMQA